MPQLIADRAVLRMTSDLGRVMAAAKAREQAGERVMHLERGEPDFDTPPHIVEAFARAFRPRSRRCRPRAPRSRSRAPAS